MHLWQARKEKRSNLTHITFSTGDTSVARFAVTRKALGSIFACSSIDAWLAPTLIDVYWIVREKATTRTL